MGVEVVDERPYQLEGLTRPSYIYEFGLRYGRPLPHGARELFQDALHAVWDGYNEIDGFNALVLGAGLTWRQATVLRAYAKYMRQGGTPFAQDYIEGALADQRRHHPAAGAAVRGAVRPRARPPGGGRGGADGEGRRDRGADRPRPRRRGQPRPRPDPALLPDAHPRDAAHQLLPDATRPAQPEVLHLVQAGAVGDPGAAGAAAEATRSSSTPRGSRACTCGSARWPAAGCAGRTAATTSAPRCWAWSRRRWSRTP